MSDKEQISEKTATEILSIIISYLVQKKLLTAIEGTTSYIVIKNSLIRIIKNDGYIKESKLEEARKSYSEIIESIKPGNIRLAFMELASAYEDAIIEIQGQVNE
jgi:hypothetical protein